MNVSYRTLLRDEFAARKNRNSHYSLRSFARDLGVSASALSQVLSHKRHLSQKNFRKVADKLSWTPTQVSNGMGEATGREVQPANDHLQLKEDVFRLMSDWYYFAILSLARLPECRPHPLWIANRLGISTVEAESALDRLKRLGFVQVRGRRLMRTTEPLTTTVDIPSSAGRQFHQQHLKLAMEALEKQEIKQREVTTITMAIDPERIAEAKRKISDFQLKLAKFLEGGKAREVYTLAIQLFSLSK